jgi:predicted ATP-dependent endonuclease of OLD family
MVICNFGCIGSEGLEIELDNIICLVGPNNTGKSTVLKAYEYAVDNKRLTEDDFCQFSESTPTVEIWVHIPKGVQNIDEKWKEELDGLLIVRNKWQWNEPGQTPVRTTWNLEIGDYDPDFKAAGIDSVFSSRLPKPLRIGALDGPEIEQSNLLKLVLEPIENELKKLTEDETSNLNNAIKKVRKEIHSPITTFVEQIDKITTDVNASYQKTFPNCAVDLKIDVSDIEIRPMALLQKGSRVDVLENDGRTSWQQQGVGSQRALFWSMLEIRSKLLHTINDAEEKSSRRKSIPIEIEKQKKEIKSLKQQKAKLTRLQKIAELTQELKSLEGSQEEPQFLPSYMLLIDEPEVALHPNAVRAAREHLYELSKDSGWQVMLTTHSPAFVNPLADHTTIVRLTRESNRPTPKIYCSDTIAFSPDEKENLKMLLQFDNSLAEAFFGGYPVIIEGDTEYAAFQKVMELFQSDYPMEKKPVLIRARGKYTIIHVANILRHFKIAFSVLHDSDSPCNKDGGVSSAWTANGRILSNIIEARCSGLRVVHRVSIPDFERFHGLEEVKKEKPYNFQKQIASTDAIRNSVKAILDDLISNETVECLFDNSNEALIEAVKKWADNRASGDIRFRFE